MMISGLDTGAAHIAHRELSGLGLEFFRTGEVGQQGEVDADGVLFAVLLADLADGF